MNILIVGTGAVCLQTFRNIIKAGHHVTAVLTAHPPYGFKGTTLADVAAKFAVPAWPGTLVKEPAFADTIRSERVDLLLSINSLYLMCSEVLAAPRIGAFNLHPSLLPRYAGLNAVSWALLHGEQSHGVTVHWMVPQLDAGPIAYQIEFRINEADTYGRVLYNCARYGTQLLERLLCDATVHADGIPRIPQDLTQRTYYSSGPPNKGCLRWASPASAIHNLLRACDNRPFPSPWGHPRTRINSKEICLVVGDPTGLTTTYPPGTVGEVDKAGVMVACADEWLLVREVLSDGKYTSAEDLLRAGERCVDIDETLPSKRAGTV